MLCITWTNLEPIWVESEGCKMVRRNGSIQTKKFHKSLTRGGGREQRRRHPLRQRQRLLLLLSLFNTFESWSIIFEHHFHDDQTFLTTLGESPGLVVMGGDSCSEGSGFEFRRRIKDGHDICSHWFVVKNCIFCLKRSKINEKDDEIGPFKNPFNNTLQPYTILRSAPSPLVSI